MKAPRGQSPLRGDPKVPSARRRDRRSAATAAAILLIALFVGGACAPAPVLPAATSVAPFAGAALPPDRLVFDSDRTGQYELFIMGADGSDAHPITDDARYDSWWPRLSPDRTAVVFYRTPKGVHDTDYTRASLWAIHVDGSGLRELRPKGTDGWDHQGHAEWSPDGSQLVMFGGGASNAQIFVTDSAGGRAKKVTDRPGTNIDPSWSPDGRSIVFVGCPQAVCFDRDYEIYVVATAGGTARRLTNNDLRDHDPYFSPDAKSIAWLSRTDASGATGIWNIRIMNADGSGQRAVTNDDQINSKPSWSRDGTVIYFHRFELARGRWGIYSVRPDGSGMRELTKGAPGHSEFPSP